MQNISNYLEVSRLSYLAIVTKSNLKNRFDRANRRLESKGTLRDWWKQLFNMKCKVPKNVKSFTKVFISFKCFNLHIPTSDPVGP